MLEMIIYFVVGTMFLISFIKGAPSLLVHPSPKKQDDLPKATDYAKSAFLGRNPSKKDYPHFHHQLVKLLKLPDRLWKPKTKRDWFKRFQIRLYTILFWIVLLLIVSACLYIHYKFFK